MSGFDPVGLETVEAEAIADAFGADAVQAGGVVCAVRPDLDEVYINRVIGLGVTEPASDALLDRIADVFGSVRHSIALAPCAQPAELPVMLREPAAMLEHLPGRPGWGCYLAYAGALPVAAGAVFVSGDHAWLGQATTLAEHRRRGGQSALMAARIGEARAAGATIIVTETGEPVDGRPANSYRNILRAGFVPAYVRPNYISPPEDAIA